MPGTSGRNTWDLTLGTIHNMRPGKATKPVFWLLGVLVMGICPAHAQSEVSIRSQQLGVGNVARAGHWAGLQLGITDLGDRVREVIVRLQVVDPDGDFTQYERVVATDPGDEKLVWVYARIPEGASGDPMTVLVNEAGETEEGVRVGRQLGRTELQLSTVASERQGMMARLGRQVGLMQYQGDHPPRLSGGRQRPSSAEVPGEHERSRVVQLSEPSEFPDRWLGLMPFSVLVWNGGPMSELGVEQAAALREWIHRGGHLVVMLGTDSAWIPDRLFNPLFDTMPLVNITRLEEVELETYRDLLTSEPRDQLPLKQVVHVFDPQEGANRSREAIEILRGSDGRCVVARRLVGSGAVTLVGLDLSNRLIVGMSLPEPELFWNRVIGKRRTMVRPDEELTGFSAIQQNTAVYDKQIEQLIDKKGAAATGVLLGFVVFLAYWLLAAPLSFIALKRAGRMRHAWLVFVGVSALFTAISWGGVMLIKPKSISGGHVSLFEHVYGQDVRRARTFASLLIPWYGEATIGVEDRSVDIGAGADTLHNAIAPFGVQTGSGFPDSRGYRIESRNPDDMTVPTRSTIKQFRVDWAGTPKENWILPVPIAGPTTQPGEVRLMPRQAPAEGVHLLEGVLQHNLPAPLRDVAVIVIEEQTGRGRDLVSEQTRSFAFLRSSDWAPGEPLDLAPLTALERITHNRELHKYLERQVQSGWGGDSPSDVGGLSAIALLNALPAPSRTQSTRVHRESTHGWDLTRWLTQPCVIVLGRLGPEEACPTPITLNGREVDLQGNTFLRWVYPLPGNPPSVGAVSTLSDPPTGDGGAN